MASGSLRPQTQGLHTFTQSRSHSFFSASSLAINQFCTLITDTAGSLIFFWLITKKKLFLSIMVLMGAFKIVLCSYVVKQHFSPCHLPVSFHTYLSVNQFHSWEQFLHISLSFPSPLAVRSVISLVSAVSLPRPTQTSQQNILMAWQVRLSLARVWFIFLSMYLSSNLKSCSEKVHSVISLVFFFPRLNSTNDPCELHEEFLGFT